MKRRTIVMLLCLSLVLFGCGRKQTAATTAAPEVPFGNYIQPVESFAGGSGTQEDPFQIETVRQLALLAEVINRNYDVEHYDDEQLYRYGYYVLTADIVLNVTDKLREGVGDGHRAVVAPGAADGDHQRGLALLHILGQQEGEQLL